MGRFRVDSFWYRRVARLVGKCWTGVVLALALAAVLVSSNSANATTYGSNQYGDCNYQACAPTSTQVTLPVTGLQVDINLHNGQVIPAAGYNIIVTPLNGQGTSFQQVDFYINGNLAQSSLPASDGTVQWFWNPNQFPGTDIKIVIMGTDGSTVTQEFQVTFASSKPSLAPGTSSNTTPPPSILQQIAKGSQQLIHNLPPTVKHTLPYFLFLILVADVLLMAWQFRREVVEARALRAILIRERQGGALKKMLVDLISHYLRTPLTIISGAIDLGSINSFSPPVVANLRQDVGELNDKVRQLIAQAQTNPVSTSEVASRVDAAHKPRASWRRPLLFIPLISVGIFGFGFDYLAAHNGSFSVNQINLVVQVVVFASLAAGLYLAIRRLELSRHDVARARQMVATEQAFNRQRDELIDQTAQGLSGGMGNLDRSVATLGPSEATAAIRQGLQQFHDVVEKCVVASQLKGATSTEPLVTATLSSLSVLTQLQQGKAEAKAVKIDITHDSSLVVRSPGLLAFVLGTILDNAIEYSPVGGHVEVAAIRTGTDLNISVTDHGPGIPEDKRFALFQAFSKVEGTEVFDHKGAGFSLYLDKLIMTYLLGSIDINSAQPRGTMVTLKLSNTPSAAT